VINTLVSTTQQTKTACLAQFVGKFLVKSLATWRQQKHWPLGLHCFDRLKNRLRSKQHSGATAIERIIDSSRFVAVVTQVVTAQIYKRLFTRTSEQTFAAKLVDEFRKNREHVDSKT
jgi:hypothetical protein